MSNPHNLSNAVTVSNGQVTTNSVKIAEVFGKRHDDVSRAIEMLQVPDDFKKRNFAELEIPYKNGMGKTVMRKAYAITRDGFTILVMGFTGAKAMEFKLAYLEEFNRMESKLRELQGGMVQAELPLADATNAEKVAAAGVPWFKAEGTYCGVPVMTQASFARLIDVDHHSVACKASPSENRGMLVDNIDIFRTRRIGQRSKGGFYEGSRWCTNLLTESGARKFYRHYFGPDAAPHRVATVPALVPAPPAPVPGVLLDLPRKGTRPAELPDLSVSECLEDTCVTDILEKLAAAGYDVEHAYVVASMTRAAVVHYRDMLESIRRSAINGLTISRFSLARGRSCAPSLMKRA